MDRCSPFLWAGVLLQALAALLVVGGFWYVGQFIPDGPERMSSKGITYTPQTVYHTRILILAGGGTLLAAVLSLVGLLEGPRNRRCIICGAPSICCRRPATHCLGRCLPDCESAQCALTFRSARTCSSRMLLRGACCAPGSFDVRWQ